MSHGTHGFATVPVKFPDRKFMLVVSITVQLLAEFERCWINKQYSQFYRKLEEFWISCKRVCGWHIRKSDSSDQTGVSFSQPPVFYHFQWAIFPGSSYAETISFKSRLSVPNFVRQNPERKVRVWGYNSIPQSDQKLTVVATRFSSTFCTMSSRAFMSSASFTRRAFSCSFRERFLL